MSTNFASFLAEDRRLVILRVLAEMPAYRSNSFLLHTLLAKWGHEPSTEQVKDDLARLQELDYEVGKEEFSYWTAKRTDKR